MSQDNSGKVHEFAGLSDEDVNTLYEIIVLNNKQEDGPSFGPGIFSAYDEIITRHGISYEGSRKFFAFICRMVSGRRPGQTPMQRFETLLAEAGMNIEIVESELPAPIDGQLRHEEARDSHERQKRSSSDEPYGGAGSQAETLAEDELPARTPQNSGFVAKTGVFDAPRRRNSLPLQDSRTYDADDALPIPGLGDPQRDATGLPFSQRDHAPPRRRTLSVTSNRSLRNGRNGTHGNEFGNGDAYSADESDALSGTRSRALSGNEGVLPPLVLAGAAQSRHDPAQRSNAVIKDNAKIPDGNTTAVGRGILGEWARKAMERRAQNEQLERIATTFDRRKLLCDAVREWRRKLESRQIDRAWAENETFYRTIEDNAAAERARNLKWIAFTHWDQTTKEAREKTAVAKRHILRRRYFSAWNNVTAVNELKVQRFILRRTFNTWERRMHELDRMEVRANAFHEVRLMQKTYMLWAFAFYDKVSPQWYGQRRMREYFLRWRDTAQQMRQRTVEVEHMYLNNVSRKAFGKLFARSRRLQTMELTAQQFRYRRLLSTVLAMWKREAVLSPKAAQLLRVKDNRLLRGALGTWNHQASLEFQAQKVFNQRVLRNAFTAWNDELRGQFLESQINVRLRAEAFYRLTLTLRGIVVERGHSRIIAGSALQHWLAKAQGRQRSIAGAEQTFEASQRRRRLHQALEKLVAAARLRQQQDAQAQEFRARRLLASTFSKWQRQHLHVVGLELKGTAADFYILTTRSLKALGQATERHRKERKRQAYLTTRRQNKVNLGRQMFMRMQEMMAHVRNLDHVASEWHEDHNLNHARGILVAWKDKAVSRSHQERVVKDIYQQKVLRSTLQKLIQRGNEIASMNREARQFSAGSAGAEAMTCLRKMDRRLFQLQRQEAGAVALREKFWEKHVRIMLRYWLEQARAKVRERSSGGGDDDNPLQGYNEDASGPGDGRGFHRSTATAPGVGDLSIFDTTTWNFDGLDLNLNALRETVGPPEQRHGALDLAFDPNDGLTTSTPLPGYLRTPSKRNTARVKARERLAASTSINPGITTRSIRFAGSTTEPGPAVPRQQTASAPPTLPSPSRPQTGVTPFERKLREQGYASSSRVGRATPGTSRFGSGIGTGPSPSATRFGAAIRGSTTPSGWPSGMNTPRRGGFAGFEDIPEISEGGTR